MKFRGVYVILLILCTSSFVLSHAVIEHTIVSDEVLTKITMDPGLKSFVIPYDSAIASANKDYKSEQNSFGIIIVTEATTFEFLSKSYIEKGDTNSFFVARNPFEESSEVSVLLPSGSTFSKDTQLVFPKNPTLSTNGENIIISWETVDDELLLEYSHPSRSGYLWYVYSLIIIAILVAIYFWYMRTSSSKEKLTANLYKDEKRIISYLSKKKEKWCWTKELVKELGISKVTLSRKLRILEEKGLISKEPYGNENRVMLKP